MTPDFWTECWKGREEWSWNRTGGGAQIISSLGGIVSKRCLLGIQVERLSGQLDFPVCISEGCSELEIEI